MSSAHGAGKTAARPLPSGTVNFLFTDIEGSTHRWESHRAEMEEAVARHDHFIRAAVGKHQGAVFKTIGDAFCAAFSRPQDAVAAALDAQRAIAAEDFSAVGGLCVRMAIHTGTAQERDGDYYGPTVNRVARLLAIGHGGQVLVSGTAAELLQAVLPQQTSLRDLGEHQLRDLVRPEKVFQLVAPGLVEIFPSLRSLESLPNNLPRQATAFVGRDQELADIKSLVQKSQIVTVVGTGGVGKTRAALQVGADLLDGAGAGVWFVDLAQIGSDEYVVPAIASVFGLKQQPDSKPLDDVCLHLKNKRLLLILDNCEHLVGETTRLVAALVKQCPRVVVLATSREALNVHGEQVYRLPSLSVPSRNGSLSAREALTYGAIALFVARATALDSQFSFTDDKAAVVADICRRLDGIALAIELAAARVTILNLKQLSQRLDERFRLLTGGDRTALPRQQTMRAAIDWSYELLSEEERTVFRRLSVFQGGWTLEAATDVCGDETIDEFRMLDILSSLVNKSLIAVDFAADTQRYRLLESLRQYGLELLRKRDEFDTVARRHANFFAAYGRRIAEKWQVIAELEWIAFVEAELDNMRAALLWCLEQGKDSELGAEIAERLWAYFFGHYVQEGTRWLEAARDTITYERNPKLSVSLDLALSRLLIGSSWSAALHAIERAVTGARKLEDERIMSRALFYRGEAFVFEGKLNEAEPVLLEARELAHRVGDTYREIASLQQLAKVYSERTQFELARQHYALTRRYYGSRGPERNYGLSLIDQALLERNAGNLERAIELSEEATAIGHLLRDHGLEVFGCCARAAHLIMAGRFAEARGFVRYGLLMSRDEAFMPGLMRLLPSCVALATHDGNLESAARLFGNLALERPDRLPATAFFTLDLDWLRQQLRERLGDEHLSSLMSEGAAWSQEQTLEAALAVS